MLPGARERIPLLSVVAVSRRCPERPVHPCLVLSLVLQGYFFATEVTEDTENVEF